MTLARMLTEEVSCSVSAVCGINKTGVFEYANPLWPQNVDDSDV